MVGSGRSVKNGDTVSRRSPRCFEQKKLNWIWRAGQQCLSWVCPVSFTQRRSWSIFNSQRMFSKPLDENHHILDWVQIWEKKEWNITWLSTKSSGSFGHFPAFQHDLPELDKQLLHTFIDTPLEPWIRCLVSPLSIVSLIQFLPALWYWNIHQEATALNTPAAWSSRSYPRRSMLVYARVVAPKPPKRRSRAGKTWEFSHKRSWTDWSFCKGCIHW